MINNLNKGVVVAAFMEGISYPHCLITLARMAPKTMLKLVEEVKKKIGVEETLQGHNIFGLSALLPSSKRLGEHNSPTTKRRGSRKTRKKKISLEMLKIDLLNSSLR